MRVTIDPPREWKDIFDQTWRSTAAHYVGRVTDAAEAARAAFDARWLAAGVLHRALLERVASRVELGDVLDSLLAELGSSHAYVSGGDYEDGAVETRDSSARRGAGGVEGARPARLGAELEWDAARGAYRVVRLARGDPWRARARGALAAPGVGVSGTGDDFVLAIDGQRLTPGAWPPDRLSRVARTEMLVNVVSASAMDDAKRALVIEWRWWGAAAQRRPRRPRRRRRRQGRWSRWRRGGGRGGGATPTTAAAAVVAVAEEEERRRRRRRRRRYARWWRRRRGRRDARALAAARGVACVSRARHH